MVSDFKKEYLAQALLNYPFASHPDLYDVSKFCAWCKIPRSTYYRAAAKILPTVNRQRKRLGKVPIPAIGQRSKNRFLRHGSNW